MDAMTRSAADVVVRAQMAITRIVEATIPPELWASFCDLTFAGMAELPDFAPWREMLLVAEREYEALDQ